MNSGADTESLEQQNARHLSQVKTLLGEKWQKCLKKLGS